MAAQVLEARREQFTISKAGALVAEASDLGIRAGAAWPKVIAVPRRETGEAVLFRFMAADTDREGDLLGCRYESYNLMGLKVQMVVFND
jgi:hypothetical protein